MAGNQIVGTCINCGPWGSSLVATMLLIALGACAAVISERRKSRMMSGELHLANG